MAVTGLAPSATAPITALSPTPPRPITTTDSPACTFAVWRTAPIPVVTAQPMSAATSGGVLGSILIAADAATTCRSPNVPIPLYAPTASPFPRVQPRQLRRETVAAAVGLAAQPWLVARARLTPTAGRGPGENDQVARLEIADALAELLDPRGALVPHHDACRALPLAVHDVEVGVTDPRGRHSDPDLASLRRVERQLFDPWLRFRGPGRRRRAC